MFLKPIFSPGIALLRRRNTLMKCRITKKIKFSSSTRVKPLYSLRFCFNNKPEKKTCAICGWISSPTKLRNYNSDAGATKLKSHSSDSGDKTVDYHVVKDVPNHPEKLLVDVRELSEIQKTGTIPSAIVIPSGRARREFAKHVSNEDFQRKYGKPKPTANTEIILYCKSGNRASQVQSVLSSMGYKNVATYTGSWNDWAKRKGLN